MAAPKANPEVDPRDWAGMVSWASTRSQNPTAMALQVNMACLAPGEVTVRPGLRAVTFDTAPTVPPAAGVGGYGLFGIPHPLWPFAYGTTATVPPTPSPPPSPPPATAPTAAFTGVPLAIGINNIVGFTDASTNTPTSWLWDFGDGGTATTQNPWHLYTVAGSYTVTLTASNLGGSDAEVKTGYVTVTASPPPPPPGPPPPPVVAAFSGTPLSGTAPLAVTFTDASTGSPTSWFWDYGDGGSSATQNPVYYFNAPGTYTVRLTAATSLASDQEEKVGYITVSPASPPPPPPVLTAVLNPVPARLSGADFGLPTGDYTIKVWLKYVGPPNAGFDAVVWWGGTGAGEAAVAGVRPNSGAKYSISQSGAAVDDGAASSSWTEVTYTYTSATDAYSISTSGGGSGSGNMTTTLGSSATFYVGDTPGGGSRFQGLISDLRIWDNDSATGDPICRYYFNGDGVDAMGNGPTLTGGTYPTGDVPY